MEYFSACISVISIIIAIISVVYARKTTLISSEEQRRQDLVEINVSLLKPFFLDRFNIENQSWRRLVYLTKIIIEWQEELIDNQFSVPPGQNRKIATNIQCEVKSWSPLTFVFIDDLHREFKKHCTYKKHPHLEEFSLWQKPIKN